MAHGIPLAEGRWAGAGVDCAWVGIDVLRARSHAALDEGRQADPCLPAEVAALNRKIRDFRLLAPCTNLQKPRLGI
jgi:hypothetical protein